MSSYGMCPYVLCILHSTRFWYKRRGFPVYLYVTIEIYLLHLKLYGWYEQYGKYSYIISGF